MQREHSTQFRLNKENLFINKYKQLLHAFETNKAFPQKLKIKKNNIILNNRLF